MVSLANTGIKPPKYIAAEKLDGQIFNIVGATEGILNDKGTPKSVINFNVLVGSEEFVMTLGSNPYRQSFAKHFANGGKVIGPVTLIAEKQRDTAKFKTWTFKDVEGNE